MIWVMMPAAKNQHVISLLLSLTPVFANMSPLVTTSLSENPLANHSDTIIADDNDCSELGILDLPYYHHCFNLSDPRAKGCELEYPCEVRRFLYSMSGFISITRAFLSYGTFLIIVLGLFLNSLSFYTLMSSGLSKSGSGIYMLSLAVCDCGNLVTNYAVGIARGHAIWFNQYFMDDEWLCRLHGVFVEVFQLISAWIVVCFTVERCIAIWYPILLRHKSRTKRARVVVFSLSAVLTLFSLSKLFLTGFEGDSVFGYPPCFSRRYRWEGVAYVRVAFQTWIPTVMVFVFNLLMFYELQRMKRLRKQLTKYKRPGSRGEGVRRTSFITRPSPTAPMLIAVSLTYLTLVFPLGIVQTTELVWNINHKPPVYSGAGVGSEMDLERQRYVQWKTTKLLLKYIRSSCFGFYQINFAINFFLYFAAGQQFRLHLQRKIKGLFKRMGIDICGDGTQDSKEGYIPSATASTFLHSTSRTSSRIYMKRSQSNTTSIRSCGSRKVEFEDTHPDSENSAAIPLTVVQLTTINNNFFLGDKIMCETHSSDSEDEENNKH